MDDDMESNNLSVAHNACTSAQRTSSMLSCGWNFDIVRFSYLRLASNNNENENTLQRINRIGHNPIIV